MAPSKISIPPALTGCLEIRPKPFDSQGTAPQAHAAMNSGAAKKISTTHPISGGPVTTPMTPPKTPVRLARKAVSQEKYNEATAKWEGKVLDRFHTSHQISDRKKLRERRRQLEAIRAHWNTQYSIPVMNMKEDQLIKEAREDAEARFYDSIGGSSFLDETPKEGHAIYVDPCEADIDLPFEEGARRMQLSNEEIDEHGWLEGWKYTALAMKIEEYHRLYSERREIIRQQNAKKAAKEQHEEKMKEAGHQNMNPRDIFPEWFFFTRA